MKVYVAQGSGNAYKVLTLIALLDIPCEIVTLDLGAKREHKQATYLAVNPRGEVPALEDDGVALWDSASCLVYLARKYGGDRWLPIEPAPLATVMQWVVFAGAEIQYGLQYARRGLIHGRWTAGSLEQCQAIGRSALAIMQRRLSGHDWLALDRPTIADIACFAYVELAPEARVELAPYPGVVAWLNRCKALPQWPQRPTVSAPPEHP